MTHPKIIEAARAMLVADHQYNADEVMVSRSRLYREVRELYIKRAEAAARVLLSIEPSEGMVAAPEDWRVRADGPRYCWSTMQAELRKELDL